MDCPLGLLLAKNVSIKNFKDISATEIGSTKKKILKYCTVVCKFIPKELVDKESFECSIKSYGKKVLNIFFNMEDQNSRSVKKVNLKKKNLKSIWMWHHILISMILLSSLISDVANNLILFLIRINKNICYANKLKNKIYF